MCGIVGYVGERETSGVLIEGLKRLEYRGYDSSGIVVAKGKERLLTYKQVGRVAELAGSIPESGVVGTMGIAHTRWATHGEPNEQNAHPHLDCEGKLAIVHNGIIENYHALRQLLETEGHKFRSMTDSEVLAHLIEKFLDQGELEMAVNKALKLVDGTYGIAVVSNKGDKLVAAKKGSPLLIGKGQGEMFVASDAAAVRMWTNRVVYLEDGEIATISANSYRVDIDGREVEKEIEEIKWSIGEIEKGGYKYFMQKEIFNQPNAIEDTLRGHITPENKVKLTVTLPENMRRSIILGCGSSWHAAQIGQHYFERFAEVPTTIEIASEFRYRDAVIGENDLVVALSQSGETADTLAAVKMARDRKATTLGIVNVVSSSIAREVDSGIYVHAGPEIGVATTKAFSCQVVDLLLLSIYMRQMQGKDIDPMILEDLRQLPTKIAGALQVDEQMLSIAKEWKDVRSVLYMARGVNFPSVQEGALKLKELAYIPASAYAAGEMKHGPIALIDDETRLVFVLGQNGLYEKTISNMEEAKARGGRILAICSQEDERVKKLAEWVVMIPRVSSDLEPVVSNIPMQLLAYHIADQRGYDVDKPRNLAKSVTVE